MKTSLKLISVICNIVFINIQKNHLTLFQKIKNIIEIKHTLRLNTHTHTTFQKHSNYKNVDSTECI